MRMGPAMNGTPGSDQSSHRFEIREATKSELPELSDLCLRSKAVWGYDQSFLDACRAELTLDESELLDSVMGVGTADDTIIGLVQIRLGRNHADLEKIFVEPRHLGHGYGRVMFEWALHEARASGAQRLVVHADPSAALFYRAMGMVDAGHAPSGSIPGRMLPRLILEIGDP